jgi:hypothetical protein
MDYLASKYLIRIKDPDCAPNDSREDLDSLQRVLAKLMGSEETRASTA